MEITYQKHKIINLLTICLLACFTPSQALQHISSVYGYIEPITLLSWDTSFEAKLDTGADSSSISAKDINIHTIDSGEKFVSFRLSHPNILNEYYYDLPLVKEIFITNRKGESKADKNIIRPVVKIPICFDKKIYHIEVNLIDRSELKYSMLIGRDALKQFNADIDPSSKNTIKSC